MVVAKHWFFQSISNPSGAEDPTRCAHAVEWHHVSKWDKLQCSRRRTSGPNGGYCKQHARLVAKGVEL